MPKLFGSQSGPRPVHTTNHPGAGFPSSLSRLSRTVSLALWRWRSLWILGGSATVLSGLLLLAQPSGPGTTEVVVAKTNLALGAVLNASDISTHALDIDPTLLGQPLSKPEVIGAKVGVPITAGTIIRASDLVTNDVFSGAPPGSVFTVVSIENAGILDYLSPGMRLDLLGSVTGAPPGEGTATGVLAQRVVVIALSAHGALPQEGDQSTTPWSQDAGQQENSSTVLVATTSEESKALASGSGWQGVHAVIVQ